MKIIIAKDLNKEALKTAYENALTSLAQIQTATNPTNAQIVQAIKKEAEILEKLLRFIKNYVI